MITLNLIIRHYTGLSLTLVYSSTNMSKSVWTSGFWKPLVHKNMSNFWNNIFHKFSIPKSNPHVLNFFDLILTIPATSAACEWGFTHMKLLKSQQRSSLKEDIVSDCLMIKLEGDSIKISILMHQSSTDLMLLQGDQVAVKQWKISSMQKRQ